MIFYFSGCGNSRWVAQELANELNDELQYIPDLQRANLHEYTISSGESIGFVFPIYSWAAPQLVTDFVRQMHWHGTSAYTWFACTCGDEMGMTHHTFSKTLRQSGLEVNAVFGIQMPNTYVCFPGFGLDSEEKIAKKISNAKAYLPQIAAAIRERRTISQPIVGSLPRLKSYLIQPGFVKNVSDKKFYITESCNGCGKCAKLCPLDNIKLIDKHPQWQGHCTQCLACYHHCPHNAIQYGSTTNGKGQYLFEKYSR